MANGLYELDGAYYFAWYDGTLVTNGSAYVETTELSGNGWYGFGADGKLIMTGFVTGKNRGTIQKRIDEIPGNHLIVTKAGKTNYYKLNLMLFKEN